MLTAINGNHFERVSKQNENKLPKKYVKKWHCALRVTALVVLAVVVVVKKTEVVVLRDSRCTKTAFWCRTVESGRVSASSGAAVWTGDLHFPSGS